MKKVCFLLSGFQGTGGIGRVTSILVNNLCDESDFEVHTISYFQKNEPLLYEISEKVINHVMYDELFSMTSAILSKHAISIVRSILKGEMIDYLVACGALYYPLAILACKGTKTKCICWEHTNPATSSDYKFQNLCRKYAASRCDYMVVLTQAAEQYYKQRFPACENRITQIYNPIATSAVKSTQYDNKSHRIISVGRLTYQKNFERLITMAKRILPEYPEWSWDIYGDGELRDSLQELVDRNNLGTQLKLRGQVSDLYNRYGEYSFMVMTSRYEGFPMSLIEGAANRLPLVSFDIPTGPNEIISDGINGYLIDQNSDDDMVKKISTLIESPEIRESMSKEAYRLTDAFVLERILEQWKILYNKLK